MSATRQISAFISEETKAQVETYVKRHGVKKAYLIEEALQHHLQALRDNPEEIVIAARLRLKAMLELALNLRDQIGCSGVVVDAKPESVDFYNQLGFSRIAAITGMLDDRPEPAPMWLPIQLIAKAAQE